MEQIFSVETGIEFGFDLSGSQGSPAGTPVFGTASLMPNAAVIGENPVYGAAEMED